MNFLRNFKPNDTLAIEYLEKKKSIPNSVKVLDELLLYIN